MNQDPPAGDPPGAGTPESGTAGESGGSILHSGEPASAADLRHALRTPLNHILGYSELLLDEAKERHLQTFVTDLQKIHAAGKELLALIDSQFAGGRSAVFSSLPALASRGPARSLRDTAPTGDRERADRTAGPEAPRARVLVVDDNELNRDMVSRLLRQEGYAILTAENGAQALALIQTEPVDLALLDVMMPVMDGFEACKKLKDNPETRLIPVVIMTALGQVEDRVKGIQAGADDFLTKPVDRDELLARIETSLRLKQAVDHKVDMLKGAQEYLAKFVPQSVKRMLDENPAAPQLERTDQDVSALFVDVTGYTKLCQDTRQAAIFLIERYFSNYLDSIHANEGDVAGTAGDDLMVVFPDADPKENAKKAVKTALEIMQKTNSLNAQLRGIFDPISVHIGINSGVASIGPTKYEGASGSRWTYTALGPAINLAARIAGIAEGGMICVGPETARRIEGQFATKELGEKQLKNVKGEVRIFQVTGGVQD